MKKIKIFLSGPEGNALAIMGKVRSLLKEKSLKNEYISKATSSDYKNLLTVSEEYAKKAGYELQFV
jgi:hypothetical protein